MKLINYQLQTKIESLSEIKSQGFFKDYIQTILEDTTKPYHQRCDYVGLSLQELKIKIDYLAISIKEMQNLKKKLAESLEIGKELTAEVFVNNGIDRIDGTIISSLTLSKPTTKVKESITIKDINAVIELGYFNVDMEAVEIALKTDKGMKELANFISIDSTKVITPTKVKINTKRTSSNTTETDEILTIEQKQAA